MEVSQTQKSGGIGFIGLLTIVFIVLKLTGYIDWSWWWVLSPIWISVLGVVGITVLLMAGAFIWAMISVGTNPVKLWRDYRELRREKKKREAS